MENDKQELRGGATSGMLYLAFHGEIVFFDSCSTTDPLVAYAPEMNIHVYSAGPWLAEKRIPKGMKLKLEGVKTGTANFKQRQDLTVTFYSARQAGSSIPETSHMVIDLPRPDAIFSGGRQGSVRDEIHVSPPAEYSRPADNRVALCIVFQYSLLEGSMPPMLKVAESDPMDGKDLVWFSQEVMSGVYVMHVFAEADIHPGPMHVEMASQASAALLGVKMTLDVHPSLPVAAPNPIPPGLFPGEINLTLANRTPFLAGIGQQLHQGNTHCMSWVKDGDFGTEMGASQCGLCVGLPCKMTP